MKMQPPPVWSARLYVEINPSMVHMFRFLLEAEDNLGFMSVVDRWKAVLKVQFSPHQTKEMQAFLVAMQETIAFTILPLALAERPLHLAAVAQQSEKQ